jgi:4-hydroxy-2-oxoheptanedioate aldolase
VKTLLHQLKYLSGEYGIVGMKHSFEDEGASLDDVILMRRLTDLCGLLSFIKIGGCEAKSDIGNCIKYGIDGIIAPMVETKFALSKFISIVSNHLSDIQPYVVLESKTSYRNLDEILDYAEGKLKGVVVGRSDFANSYDLNKSEADSDFIYNKVENILVRCKKYNLYTTLGGNISKKSIAFIKDMFAKKILNRIETRNVVIELSDFNIENLDNVIRKALEFETMLMEYKHKKLVVEVEDYSKRIEILTTRI